MTCCKCAEYEWADPQEVVYTDPEGKGYCVFHAPLYEKRISNDDFNKRVFERLRESKLFEGSGRFCDLSGVVFPQEIKFQQVGQFPKVRFNSACFEGFADFSEVDFGGFALFKETIFSQGASLSEAKFNGVAYFGKTELEIMYILT
ncbi:pentapeptide repeat-containing protein [Pseudodesulfovibrio tunisiensis]|uniref:pentapeptide repeat-containing protein n=1 Tax=Pseudodesulfovibrio tunisiensis TaxID=463192 RepID=UPI001FB2CA6F|nr:pentapeptide repeat-containing protein [Pseudodesulfovibrio tunisiensis]